MLNKIFAKLSGWKAVIGAVLVELPVGHDSPVAEALKDFVANPDLQTAYPLAVNLILIAGAAHRVIKNMNGKK